MEEKEFSKGVFFQKMTVFRENGLARKFWYLKMEFFEGSC